MDIYDTHQMTNFFEFVRSIKYDIEDWQIVELTLTPSGEKLSNTKEIAEKLQTIFSSKKGKILICNQQEVIALIRVGKDASSTYVSQRIEKAIPQHFCSINVDKLENGFTRIQLSFEEEERNKYHSEHERDRRITPIILLIEPDESDAMKLKALLQGSGNIITVTALDAVLKTYSESAPDIVFMSTAIDQSDHSYLMQQILHEDPKAYVILMAKEGNANSVITAIEKGAKNFIVKPVNQETIDNILQACPNIKKLYAAR